MNLLQCRTKIRKTTNVTNNRSLFFLPWHYILKKLYVVLFSHEFSYVGIINLIYYSFGSGRFLSWSIQKNSSCLYKSLMTIWYPNNLDKTIWIRVVLTNCYCCQCYRINVVVDNSVSIRWRPSLFCVTNNANFILSFIGDIRKNDTYWNLDRKKHVRGRDIMKWVK